MTPVALLRLDEGVDHAVVLRHAADPAVGHHGHARRLRRREKGRGLWAADLPVSGRRENVYCRNGSKPPALDLRDWIRGHASRGGGPGGGGCRRAWSLRLCRLARKAAASRASRSALTRALAVTGTGEASGLWRSSCVMPDMNGGRAPCVKPRFQWTGRRPGPERLRATPWHDSCLAGKCPRWRACPDEAGP